MAAIAALSLCDTHGTNLNEICNEICSAVCN